MFTEGSAGEKKMLKGIKRAYVIEVLTSLHDVRRPLRLINLHPALAQELSKRERTDTCEITHILKYSTVISYIS